jgi:hypothetical protein
MATPATTQEFLELVQKSGVVDQKRLSAYLAGLRAANHLPPEPAKVAGSFVRDGILTVFQAEQILLGKWRRFTIGRYKVLERLGSGRFCSVYLCEHEPTHRQVAVKVLPTALAGDASSLERFYREARAVAAFYHPNMVRAYDVDQDDGLHFLVLEYVRERNGLALERGGRHTGCLPSPEFLRRPRGWWRPPLFICRRATCCPSIDGGHQGLGRDDRQRDQLRSFS